MREIGVIASSELQSPSYTPLVSGCVGWALRAHAKALGNEFDDGITCALLQLATPLADTLGLSSCGSFHTSQARMRESVANALTTPTT